MTAGHELSNRRRKAASDEHKAAALGHETGRDPADVTRRARRRPARPRQRSPLATARPCASSRGRTSYLADGRPRRRHDPRRLRGPRLPRPQTARSRPRRDPPARSPPSRSPRLMTADVLDRLRAADPARDLDRPAPDELLRTAASPRRAAPATASADGSSSSAPPPPPPAAAALLVLPPRRARHGPRRSRICADRAGGGPDPLRAHDDRHLACAHRASRRTRTRCASAGSRAIAGTADGPGRAESSSETRGRRWPCCASRTGSDRAADAKQYVARLARRLHRRVPRALRARDARRERRRRRSTAVPPAGTSSTRGATGASSSSMPRPGCRSGSVERFAVGVSRASFAATTIVDGIEQLPATAANQAKLNDPAATG